MISTEGVKPLFKELIEKNGYEHASHIIAYARDVGTEIFPSDENIFEAFKYHDLDETRLIIIGQDPYKDSRASGLAFASPKVIYSLANISKELERTHKVRISDPSLKHIAKQGVLLLNTSLTCMGKSELVIDHYKLWHSLVQAIIIEAEKLEIPIMILGKKGTGFNFAKPAYAFPHPSPQITNGPKFVGSDFFVYADKFTKGEKINWSE